MNIDKQQILSLLQGQGNADQVSRAETELPDQVDTDQHAGLLDKLGINLPDLLGGNAGPGGEQGGIGGIAGKLGL